MKGNESYRKVYLSCLFVVSLIICTTTAFATVLRVRPGDYQTIQEAIDVAEAGDTLLVADGTYTGVGNKNLDFHGKAITVQSENGPENCIIDCEREGRGFLFHSGEGKESVLSGFTITNGYTYLSNVGFTGAGIECFYFSSPTINNCIIMNNNSALSGAGIMCDWDSSPAISNCVITGNYTSRGSGGGISCDLRSSPTIINCIISNNVAAYHGGGINCSHESSPKITDCTITSNSTLITEGGGVFCYFSSPTITDCIISTNAARAGGGLYFYSSPIPVVANCVISDNTSLYGSGIYWRYSSITIAHSVIIGNTALNGDGGGLWVGEKYLGSPAKILNCIIAENTTPTLGGGIYFNDSRTLLTNCTIGKNSAGQGGGIYCSGPSGFFPTITNSIIWDNTNDEIYPDSLDITYSDIKGGYSGTGNIDADPVFVNPETPDFHLQQGSPCIDAGTNDAPNLPDTDVEGDPRIIDGDFDGTETTDMGADEYIPPNECPHCGDCTMDGNLTPEDALMAFQYYLGIEDPPMHQCQIDQADVTLNSEVTPADALCIFEKYLGIASCLDGREECPWNMELRIRIEQGYSKKMSRYLWPFLEKATTLSPLKLRPWI